MSNSNSSTFQSYSTSYTSSSINGETKSASETTYSDPSGTRVHRTTQNPGEAAREEKFEVDNAGRRVESGGAGDQMRIEDVTEEEDGKNARKYEERMEDEYAKREGGA